MNGEETREITIRGKILPAEWDKDRNVTGIGIETDDEEDYIIFLNKTGEKLLSYIERNVEATGTVKKMYGEYIFTVNSYTLLEEDDEKK